MSDKKLAPLHRRRIGLNIRNFRKDNGRTQAWLARRAGVHRQTIVHLEAGDHSPSIGVLYALARALGCTPGSLLDARQ